MRVRDQHTKRHMRVGVVLGGAAGVVRAPIKKIADSLPLTLTHSPPAAFSILTPASTVPAAALNPTLRKTDERPVERERETGSRGVRMGKEMEHPEARENAHKRWGWNKKK